MLRKIAIVLLILLGLGVLACAGLFIFIWLALSGGSMQNACKRFTEEELTAAIANGLDVNAGCCIEHMIFECSHPNPNGNLLVYAVEAQDLAFAKSLIAQSAEVNRFTENGYPLSIAISLGSKEMFDLLVAQGPNAESLQQGLRMVARYARPDMASVLLSRVPAEGRTRACNELACELVQEFIQPTANAAQRDIMSAILESCVDPNALCSTEHLLTQLARHDENVAFVKTMIDRGADLNATERNGRTVLTYLQHFNDYDIRPKLKELLEGAHQR
jgi:ankyrin repeat protein